MISKDGNYTFYKIQHLQKDGKDGKWVYSNFDSFCEGWDYTVEPYRSFTSIAECWQEIGEHGCYDLSISLSLLKQIAEAYPKRQFRLVKIHITQKTTRVEHVITNIGEE